MIGNFDQIESSPGFAPTTLEGIIERFEADWHSGNTPEIDSFLPDDDDARWPVLVELVHAELEFRLKSGAAVKVEEYLERYPELAGDRTVLLDLVATEFKFRQRHKSNVTIDEYHQRFPQYKEDLSGRLSELIEISSSEPGVSHLSATVDQPVEAFQLQETTDETPLLKAGKHKVIIPGYEILGTLGRGGMGVVYKARHLLLKRVVALKMILAGQHASAEQLNRFLVEAEAAAKLQHPNIVQIHEIGEADGQPFFSLEYVDGGSLANKIAGTPQAPREAAQTVETLARAMHVAHEQGIIHRDLKPVNVLLTKGGTAKITDFGLAKQLEDESGQTHSSAILGTPSYMAPEQALGLVHQVGPLADVYALGAILYEMLTGRPPFKGATSWDTLAQVREQEPVPPSRFQPKVPRDLETICLKCLQRQPNKRYAGALELADDLHHFLNQEPIRARPTPAWERSWKWARRHPARAGMLVLGVLTLTAGLALAGLYIRFLQKEVDEIQRRETAQNEVERLCVQGQEALDSRAFDRAAGLLEKALARIGDDLLLDKLKGDVERKIADAKRGIKDQADLRQLNQFQDDAYFHETFMTGLTEEQNLQAVQSAAEKGLALFGIAPDAGAASLELSSRSFSADEQKEVRIGCYDLLLGLASAEIDLAKKKTGADQRRRGFEQALRILDRAAELGQSSQAFASLRADCLRRLDRVAEARQAEKDQPPAPVGYFDHYRLGLECHKADKPDEALVHFQMTLREQPRHFWAQYCLALCHVRRGRPAAAEGYLTACIGHRPDFAWNYIYRGFVRGQLAEQEQKRPSQTHQHKAEFFWQAAEADFRAALARNPNDTARYGILTNRGTLLIMQGKQDEALESLRQAVALNPNEVAAYQSLAIIYQNRQQPKQALEQLNQAIKLRPRWPPLYRSRAHVYRDMGDKDAALADYERAIQFESSDSLNVAEDHVQRGNLLRSSKKYKEAVFAYQAALKIAPAHPETLRQQGQAFLDWAETSGEPDEKRKMYEQAAHAFDEYVRSVKQPEATAYQKRGWIRTKLGNHAGAVDDLTRALELKPDVDSYLLRGWEYLLNMEAPKLAQRDFEEALRLDAKNGDAYNGRGQCRARLGQYREGVADVENALSLGPRSPFLLYNAARTFAYAAGRIDIDTNGKPAGQLALRRQEYAEKALTLLRQALEKMPAEQRAAFWNNTVRTDNSLLPLRRSDAFTRLATEYGSQKK